MNTTPRSESLIYQGAELSTDHLYNIDDVGQCSARFYINIYGPTPDVRYWTGLNTWHEGIFCYIHIKYNEYVEYANYKYELLQVDESHQIENREELEFNLMGPVPSFHIIYFRMDHSK